MEEIRSEIHIISYNHRLYKYCDEICFKTKNLYNYANYIMRQKFIHNEGYINEKEIRAITKHSEVKNQLPSNIYQETLRILLKDWKSFYNANKSYFKNPSKFLGKPRIPKYKKKDGRTIASFTWAGLRRKNSKVYFTSSDLFIETKREEKIQQVRIIPVGNVYKIELIYYQKIENKFLNKNKNVVGIDLGIDNFATCVNNIGIVPIIINGKIIKSINHYYNKHKSRLQSKISKENLKWSNRLYSLTLKRNNKINYEMHKYSKYLVSYCVTNNIHTIIIGKNKKWKQRSNMGRKNNQNFVSIPHEKFIKQLEYKARVNGIVLIRTEESYTSGCSFLDNEETNKHNYNKKRRIKRGLFCSNEGILINADVNGAYNIIKKVFPNSFEDGIKGVHLHPIRINV